MDDTDLGTPPPPDPGPPRTGDGTDTTAREPAPKRWPLRERDDAPSGAE